MKRYIPLFEEFINYIAGRHNRPDTELYKNPRSINKFAESTRAVITDNGDMYIIDNAMSLVHTEIMDYIKTRGLYSGKMFEFLRYYKTNTFVLSESWDNELVEAHDAHLTQVCRRAKKKMPQY